MEDIINKNGLAEATAWHVEKALSSLAYEYEAKVESNWLELAGAAWLNQGRQDKNALAEAVNKEAVRVIAINRSTWSGGNSVKNMCEQINRDVAVKWANSFVLRLTDSCLNDAADRVQEIRNRKKENENG
jgi:hypothetical protein